MSTRQEMENQIAEELLEYEGTPGFTWQDTRDRDLYTSCDELARASYCYWTVQTADIVLGQQDYCAPTLTRIKAVYCFLDDGGIRLLWTEDSDAFDMSAFTTFGQNWRSNPLYNSPSYWQPSGLNRGRLYPIPNYNWGAGGGSGAAGTATITSGALASIAVSAAGASYTSAPRVAIIGDGSGAAATSIVAGGVVTGFAVTAGGSGYTFARVRLTGGLAFEGYGVPGSAAWPLSTSDCPLPPHAERCVILGACLKRARRLTPGDRSRINDLEAEYTNLRGEFVRVSHTQARSTREHGRTPAILTVW